jgi:hypothetical protein
MILRMLVYSPLFAPGFLLIKLEICPLAFSKIHICIKRPPKSTSSQNKRKLCKHPF